MMKVDLMTSHRGSVPDTSMKNVALILQVAVKAILLSSKIVKM